MNNTPRTDELTFDVVVKRGDAHLVREHYKDGSGDFVESDFVRQLERELNAANENTRRLHDCLETAWGIIANVSGGDWTRQKSEWQEAVVRWRDNQFDPIMKELSERRAKENK